MYKLTDEQFKEALRQAVIEHAGRPDGPYQGKLPDYFVPLHPVWRAADRTINRQETLALGPYSYIPADVKAAMLEERT